MVDYNLHILRREGYIKRSPDISRGIQLLDRDTGRAVGLSNAVAVPVYGAIAAGEPLMAFPDANGAGGDPGAASIHAALAHREHLRAAR